MGKRIGHHKGQHVDEHRCHHGEDGGEAQGGEKLGILEDLNVIADAHPGSFVDGGEFAEGQIKAFAEGNDKANDKGQEGWQHEDRPPFFRCFDQGIFLLFLF